MLRSPWRIIGLVCLIAVQAVVAQNRMVKITGYVQDANTHQSLSEVQVTIPGTNIGTVTNMRGHFILEYPISHRSKSAKIQHIAYEAIEFKISEMKDKATYNLKPRIIPLQGIRVEAEGQQVKIKQDLPQAIRVMEARQFQNKGYADAADMLKTDHSVQVSESTTGRRQVSVRGGNADETVILYNNIRLNRLYDSRFDLSLIDVDEMARMEVIKGSNTILYGTGALAGVINIVPQFKRDYHIKFKQSVGSYDAGNWSVQGYQGMGPVDLTFTVKKGATQRQYESMLESEEYLDNVMTHYQGNLAIRLDESGDNQLKFSGMISDFDYSNDRMAESLGMKSELFMGQYSGKFPVFGKFETSGALTRQEEQQDYSSMAYIPHRDMNSESIQFNFEKLLTLKRFDLILAYQYENNQMDYSENRRISAVQTQTVPYDLERHHHGLAAVTKYHAPSGLDFLSTFDCDVSFRRDWVQDKRIDDESIVGTEFEPDWPTEKTNEVNTVKFSAHMSGVREDLMFSAYMNYGTSVKFPSLVQQVSQPLEDALSTEMGVYLRPEKNNSAEVGVEITRQATVNDIMGWQVNANFFKNYYNNKFRYYFVPGIPVAYYDNVRTANITGVEASGRIFAMEKKFTFGVGVAKYSVSDKAAFPFKYDVKGTIDLIFEHAGWQAHAHFFSEGGQVGWVRYYTGGFGEIELDGFMNMDFFLSKNVELFGFKAVFSGSVRNVLDTEVVVAELPYRDRRFNLSMAIQY